MHFHIIHILTCIEQRYLYMRLVWPLGPPLGTQNLIHGKWIGYFMYRPGIKVRRFTDFAVLAFRCLIPELAIWVHVQKKPISHLFYHCGDIQFARFGLVPIRIRMRGVAPPHPNGITPRSAVAKRPARCSAGC